MPKIHLVPKGEEQAACGMKIELHEFYRRTTALHFTDCSRCVFADHMNNRFKVRTHI